MLVFSASRQMAPRFYPVRFFLLKLMAYLDVLGRFFSFPFWVFSFQFLFGVANQTF